MKRLMMTVCCALAAFVVSGAVKWKGMDDASYVSGPKVTPDDVLGKVVLLYFWDLDQDRSVEYLKDIEKTWMAFQTKPFQLLGAYNGVKADDKVKAAVAKYKVTFPVYNKLNADPPPTMVKAPFFCVFNHRGSAVYTGGDLKKAQENLALALTDMMGTPSLCKDVSFKRFKALEKQLVLGKSVANIVKQLTKEAEKAKDPSVAGEAQEILSALESAKSDVKGDIEVYSKADPAEAIRLIGLFSKTWPKDESVAEFKASIPDLKKAAAEKKAADKAKAKEKAK